MGFERNKLPELKEKMTALLEELQQGTP